MFCEDLTQSDQLGYVEEFQYDGEGNLHLYVDRNGNQVYRTYNVFGNLVCEKAEDSEEKDPVITTFRYDRLGRIRQAVCDGHSYEHIYNDQGMEVWYRYDSQDRIQEINYGNYVDTQYDYDGDMSQENLVELKKKTQLMEAE